MRQFYCLNCACPCRLPVDQPCQRGLERRRRRKFVLRQLVAVGFVNSNLTGNGLGGIGVVDPERHRLAPQLEQVGDRISAAFLDRVGHGKYRQHAPFVDHGYNRLALVFQCAESALQLRRTATHLFQQPMIAQSIALAVDHAAPDRITRLPD